MLISPPAMICQVRRVRLRALTLCARWRYRFTVKNRVINRGDSCCRSTKGELYVYCVFQI